MFPTFPEHPYLTHTLSDHDDMRAHVYPAIDSQPMKDFVSHDILSEYGLVNSSSHLPAAEHSTRDGELHYAGQCSRQTYMDPSLSELFASQLTAKDLRHADRMTDARNDFAAPETLSESDLLELPLAPETFPELYQLFFNDRDRRFVAEHSRLDAPILELTAEMRHVMDDVKAVEASMGQFMDFSQESIFLPAVPGETTGQYLQRLARSQPREIPFLHDISAYRGYIWKYNPKELHKLTLFDPKEGHFVDPSKFWGKPIPKPIRRHEPPINILRPSNRVSLRRGTQNGEVQGWMG